MVDAKNSYLILSHHYELNIRFLSCIGLWPYVTGIARQILNSTFAAMLLVFAVLQLSAIPRIKHNLKLLLKNMCLSIISLVFVFKYSVFWFQLRSFKEAMERVQYNWRTIEDEAELLIMEKYASMGRYHTKVFALFIYSAAAMMALSPYITDILNIAVPLNESRTQQLPVVLITVIDPQKYFYVFAVFMDLVYFDGSTTLVGTEAVSIVDLLHASGLFEIVSYRIEQALICKKPSDMIRTLTGAIRMHTRAVEFSAYLKTTFAPTYLALLVFGVISVSINLFGVSQALFLDHELLDFLVCGMFVFGEFGYMYYMNYVVQKVIDSCSNIFKQICSTKWYEAPVRIQRVILFVMLRSMDIVNFEVFGLFNPSIEGFALLMRLSLSYFMAISSI